MTTQQEATSFVYLIGERDGLYKIGFSVDPEQRLRAMPDGGRGLRVVATIPAQDARNLEKRMHKVYGVRRVHGEWFSLSKSDVSKWPATEPDAYLMNPLVDACLPFPVQIPAWLSEFSESRMSLCVTLDPATTAAMRAFIAAQPAPPSAPATSLAAIHQFLERQGFWPPKPKT